MTLDYYSFGLKQKGYNNVVGGGNDLAQKWKLNGKEFNEDLGVNFYEMDLRQYDVAIGRWIAIDPITHHGQSTYAAFDNNPVFWADPSGAATGFAGAVEQHAGGAGASKMGNTGSDPDEDEDEQNNENTGSEEGGSPEDIIFKNNKGEELGRIILPGKDQVVNVDTDESLDEPVVVDPTKAVNEPDAVGISFDYKGIFGGGVTFGVDFVLFLEGSDKGNLYGLRKIGGGVGFDNDVSASIFFSYFNSEANSNLMNAGGFKGAYSSYSVNGHSYTWSNVTNSAEVYKGMRSTTTWESFGSGVGVTQGASLNWGKTYLMNSGKPYKTIKGL